MKMSADAFDYVCERGRVKDFEQQSRVYYTVRSNADLVDHVIMESQCNGCFVSVL